MKFYDKRVDSTFSIALAVVNMLASHFSTFQRSTVNIQYRALRNETVLKV
jgi:hypothetical protein